jgi:hypothetical protein
MKLYINFDQTVLASVSYLVIEFLNITNDLSLIRSYSISNTCTVGAWSPNDKFRCFYNAYSSSYYDPFAIGSIIPTTILISSITSGQDLPFAIYYPYNYDYSEEIYLSISSNSVYGLNMQPVRNYTNQVEIIL